MCPWPAGATLEFEEALRLIVEDEALRDVGRVYAGETKHDRFYELAREIVSKHHRQQTDDSRSNIE